MHPISARSIFTDTFAPSVGISVDNIGRAVKREKRFSITYLSPRVGCTIFFYQASNSRENPPLVCPVFVRFEMEKQRKIGRTRGKVSYLGEFSTDKEISCLVDDPKIGSDVFLEGEKEDNPRGATCSSLSLTLPLIPDDKNPRNWVEIPDESVTSTRIRPIVVADCFPETGLRWAPRTCVEEEGW